MNYTFNYESELPNYRKWVAEGDLEILIYNGDADYILSHMGNNAWINQGLNLTKSSEWSPWRGSDKQVAGYFEEYKTEGKPLTFLTVKGAGHMVPKDRQCSNPELNPKPNPNVNPDPRIRPSSLLPLSLTLGRPSSVRPRHALDMLGRFLDGGDYGKVTTLPRERLTPSQS